MEAWSLAYTVHPKMGPMRARLLQAMGRWSRIRVRWLPTRLESERTVPTQTLRAWTEHDRQFWRDRAVQQQLERAPR